MATGLSQRKKAFSFFLKRDAEFDDTCWHCGYSWCICNLDDAWRWRRGRHETGRHDSRFIRAEVSHV